LQQKWNTAPAGIFCESRQQQLQKTSGVSDPLLKQIWEFRCMKHAIATNLGNRKCPVITSTCGPYCLLLKHIWEHERWYQHHKPRNFTGFMAWWWSSRSAGNEWNPAIETKLGVSDLLLKQIWDFWSLLLKHIWGFERWCRCNNLLVSTVVEA
jgi:hypothetical protein